MKFLLAALVCLLCNCSPKTPNGITSNGCINKSRPLYVLPYPVGRSYYLLQGNCSAYSHFNQDAFSYDFRMPVGTYVTAMRAGKVVNLREQFKDGSTKNNDSLNFLIILHSDSTASRYLHLTQNGVLVEKGQYINTGDTIAFSGNSGLSSEPHLHVDVTGYCTRSPCQTIPFSFKNCIDKVPVQGKIYAAQNY